MRRFDTRRLKNLAVTEKYVNALNINSELPNSDSDNNIQEYWDNIKDRILKAAEEQIEYEERARKRQISHRT